ncbi:MAG: HNH endonuclease, partial [Magnetococcales bacterium]|nr:HNH endonuclease [Magnetococcales bacterium]
IWRKQFAPTHAGTPQGGIISPVLANLTLDGLEEILRLCPSLKGKKVHVVRYADDFVVTGNSEETLIIVKEEIEKFLVPRGLELSQEKTRIIYIDEGFDFLGWNFRKYEGKLLIKPTRKSIQRIVEKLGKIIDDHKAAKQKDLIEKLNPVIRGWTEYNKHVVAKKAFSKVDHMLWEKLWRWAKRRHSNKSASWIKNKYWQNAVSGRQWVFNCRYRDAEGKERTKTLTTAADVPIKRHIKIRGEVNPYDPKWEHYLEARDRLEVNLEAKTKRYGVLLEKQKGLCPECKEFLKSDRPWQLHHIVPKSEGGTDANKNLVMLHTNCHRQMHYRKTQCGPGLPQVGDLRKA